MSTVHATTVAVQGRAVLIRGPAGSGKSGLALRLMALGARLVADDRTCLAREGAAVIASCPESLRGVIEARYVGLLSADPAPPTPLGLVVDLGMAETRRLPERTSCDILGVSLPLIARVDASHFEAAIVQYLKAGPCLGHD